MAIGLFVFSTSSWVNISKLYFSRHLSNIKFQIYWYNIPLLSYGYLQCMELCPPYFILDIIILFIPYCFLLINPSRRLPSSGTWQPMVHKIAKSWTQLSTHTFLKHILFAALLYIFSFISFYPLLFFFSFPVLGICFATLKKILRNMDM